MPAARRAASARRAGHAQRRWLHRLLHRETGTTTTITVDAPGTWCLDQDLVEGVVVAGENFTMISVDADDVTIDCGGRRLGFEGSADLSRGIATWGLQDRVTVRNCRVSGFSHAIAVAGDDFLIEDNLVRASVPSVYGNEKAIEGYGNGTIRRNRVHDAIDRAILAKGGSQVVDNLIDGISEHPGGSSRALGIEITQATGALVRGNTVRGLTSSAPNQVMGLNINNAAVGDTNTVVADNVLVHDGSEGPIGIFCASSPRVSDNVIAGFFAPMAGACVDTGDNDISP